MIEVALDRPIIAGDGWYGPERNAAGPFRWIGRSASLAVPMTGRGAVRIRLLFRGALAQDQRDSLRVEVGGSALESAWRDVPEEGPWLEAVVPEALARASPDLLYLTIATSRTLVPAEIDPTNLDRRELGVALGRVVLEAAQEDGIVEPPGDTRSARADAKVPARVRWEQTLGASFMKMWRLQQTPGLGSRAVGVEEWDWPLFEIGREWLAAHGRHASEPSGVEGNGCDVYFATQVYEEGGHTALIGDFVRALDGTAGASSQVILSNLLAENGSSITDRVAVRLGVPPGHVHALRGPSLTDRLDQAFERLIALRPSRLFLFHHSTDPLACAIAQPAVARQTLLVHHADAVPSFGLHLPGVRVIDLNPRASALTRVLGLAPALLPLTAPDPGPRPGGFFGRGRLVTATCGSAYKFSRPYVYSYADTVGVLLHRTGGWHVHIGPLEQDVLAQIGDAMDRRQVSRDRFIHIQWTPSVANTLWAEQCDLYCASFPIDGARARAEVLASGTPYLSHVTRHDALPSGGSVPVEGLVWHTWDDLARTLDQMSDRKALEEQSALMRRVYDTTHHPDRFARHLSQILEGGEGAEDPWRQVREPLALRSMMRALTAALTYGRDDPGAGTGTVVATLGRLARQVEEQQRQIDWLEDDRRRLREELDRLQLPQ